MICEILKYIEENCGEKGFQVTRGRNNEGSSYWTVSGLGVNMGGSSTFLEALYCWYDSIKYLEDRN